MVEVPIKRNGDDSADFELPEGCVLCDGTLFVRVSGEGAFSVCADCRWIGSPDVEMDSDGTMSISVAPQGFA